MPVYSMTGYASVQKTLQQAEGDNTASPHQHTRLGLEIRSVNSRFLDLGFRLPEELRQLEPTLRELVTKQLRRGKVEVRASLEAGEGASLPSPSPQALQRLAALQDKIQDWLPKARDLSVADVLRLSQGGTNTQPVDDAAWTALALEAIEAPVSYTHLTLPTICSV